MDLPKQEIRHTCDLFETQAQCTIGKRSSARIEKSTSQEEGGRAQEGSSKVGKEEWPESSKRWSEEALQISAGNCCPEADQAVPEIHRTFDQKVTISTIGMRNCR